MGKRKAPAYQTDALKHLIVAIFKSESVLILGISDLKYKTFDSILNMQCLFAKQPIYEILGLDAIIGLDKAAVHRQHNFFIVIWNQAQRAKLPFTSFR